MYYEKVLNLYKISKFSAFDAYSIPTSHCHTCSDGLVCEPICEVISVSLHMSVIIQNGDSALMIASREGRIKVVSLLLKAGANSNIQDKVNQRMCMKKCGGGY